MGDTIRVLTWNCHRATAGSSLWDYFQEMNPDIALLQEVVGIPAAVRSLWESVSLPAATKTGGAQRFQTVVLARAEIVKRIPMTSPEGWVQSELGFFAGNLVGCQLRIDEEPVNVISVYSPAWPINRERLLGVDTASVQLPKNPEVWLSDILLAALKSMRATQPGPWIAGGDFNSSETFDQPKDRGNREYLDRMAAFGLNECLREAMGESTPTFRNTRGGKIVHQMDHLFVTEPLAGDLASCGVGSRDRVFGGGLSDHLPIVADFQRNSGPGRRS